MYFSQSNNERPASAVKFVKDDFSLLDQVSAEVQTITIIGIDWVGLFSKKMGDVDGPKSINAANIPVVGGLIAADRTKNYALYNLMNQNKGYDVVFYPQYETKVVKPILGLGFITKITTVKTTARLGKINK